MLDGLRVESINSQFSSSKLIQVSNKYQFMEVRNAINKELTHNEQEYLVTLRNTTCGSVVFNDKYLVLKLINCAKNNRLTVTSVMAIILVVLGSSRKTLTQI